MERTAERDKDKRSWHKLVQGFSFFWPKKYKMY